MLRDDYLGDPSIRVLQDPDHFCLNTDTVLLAQFMKIHPGESVLDIGTNNGALLVAADRYQPARLIGVEILEEPAKVARANLARLKSPAELIEADVRLLEHEPVDVIVCNPPFFAVQPAAEKKQNLRQLGREEVNLDLFSMIEAAARLLKSHGRLYFVHRPERIEEICTTLAAHNFALKTLQPVYDRRDDQCKSVLVYALKEGKPGCTFAAPVRIG